jgi:hypothetical protein
MVGDTARLIATLRDARGNTLTGRSVAWSTSDPAVALVDGGGRVAALAPGNTVIAATSGGARGETSLAIMSRPALGTDRSLVVFAVRSGASPPPPEAVAVIAEGGSSVGGLSAVVAYGAGQPAGWLDASLSRTDAPATLTLSPFTGALDVGRYTATVTIASAQAASAGTVGVTLDVLDPGPVITLDRPAVAMKATTGGGNPAPETVRIANGGSGTLGGLAAAVIHEAGSPTGWLGASLGSTTAPATLTLTAATSSLAAGTYTADVEVTAAGADNSPQTVTVTVEIGAPPPGIEVEPLDLVLTATAGAGDPNPVNLTVRNSGSGSVTGLAASVRYPGAQAGTWLTATIAPSTAPATLRIQPHTSGLAVGVHTAFIDVSAPGVANSPVTITVTLNLNPAVVAPGIALTPTTLSFNAMAGGADPAAKSASVNNTGGGTLDDLGVSVSYAAGQPTGWLNAALTATTAPATLDVQPVTGSLPAGTYNATIDVASSAAANSPQSIDVTFTVAAAPVSPAIVAIPTSLAFNATEGSGNPAQTIVDITNGGGGTLDGLTLSVHYPSGQPSGWLNTSLAGTAAPTTLSVQPTTGSLAAGTYNATIDVAATAAPNSPVTISVSFDVTPSTVTPPNAPTNLQTGTGGRHIDLRWTDNSNNETSFVVERSLLPVAGWSAIDTLPANTTSYRDSGLQKGVRYYYRVSACNSAGCSTSSIVSDSI